MFVALTRPSRYAGWDSLTRGRANQGRSRVALVASSGSSRSADTRCLGDLRRVLLGVLTHPPGEELNGHDAERRMATLARPVGVGQRLE